MHRILEDARDIAVVGRAHNDNYIFAAKPSLDFAREIYETSVSDSKENKLNEFRGRWELDKAKGIIGASVYQNLRLDKKSLRPQGLWLPSLLEFQVLKSQGKLGRRGYYDAGIGVFSKGEPNKHHAKMLVQQASELNLSLPLLVPFSALDYQVEGKNVNISISSPKNVVSGETTDKCVPYSDKRGVQRLVRDCDDGFWVPNWEILALSFKGGRGADWICGEATREVISDAYFKLDDIKSNEEISKLRFKQSKRLEKFRSSLD